MGRDGRTLRADPVARLIAEPGTRDRFCQAFRLESREDRTYPIDVRLTYASSAVHSDTLAFTVLGPGRAVTVGLVLAMSVTAGVLAVAGVALAVGRRPWSAADAGTVTSPEIGTVGGGLRRKRSAVTRRICFRLLRLQRR